MAACAGSVDKFTKYISYANLTGIWKQLRYDLLQFYGDVVGLFPISIVALLWCTQAAVPIRLLAAVSKPRTLGWHDALPSKPPVERRQEDDCRCRRDVGAGSRGGFSQTARWHPHTLAAHCLVPEQPRVFFPLRPM